MTPGRQVICIDASKDTNTDYSMFTQWVTEGAKYTVKRNETGGRILLEEIKNQSTYFPSLMGKTEPGFHKRRFVDYEQYILGNVKEEEENEIHTVKG